MEISTILSSIYLMVGLVVLGTNALEKIFINDASDVFSYASENQLQQISDMKDEEDKEGYDPDSRTYDQQMMARLKELENLDTTVEGNNHKLFIIVLDKKGNTPLSAVFTTSSIDDELKNYPNVVLYYVREGMLNKLKNTFKDKLCSVSFGYKDGRPLQLPIMYAEKNGKKLFHGYVPTDTNDMKPATDMFVELAQKHTSRDEAAEEFQRTTKVDTFRPN